MAFDHRGVEWMAPLTLLALLTGSVAWWITTRSVWAGVAVGILVTLVLAILVEALLEWRRERTKR
jgi:membrane-bound metal-dependent hydrolase YbcI (DUF457 family)